MTVIANTTIISNFAAVGRLDVLRDLLGEVYISTEVYAEIQDGRTEGYDFYGGIEAHIHPLAPGGWLHLTSFQGDEELRLFNNLPPVLHRGEASSLAIAAQRGWAILTDDARARQAARELGVRLSGTLGVLIQAIKADLLSVDEANQLLGQMVELGYRSPYDDLTELG
jgi:predicted nucleic acid-binding protein